MVRVVLLQRIDQSRPGNEEEMGESGEASSVNYESFAILDGPRQGKGDAQAITKNE